MELGVTALTNTVQQKWHCDFWGGGHKDHVASAPPHTHTLEHLFMERWDVDKKPTTCENAVLETPLLNSF